RSARALPPARSGPHHDSDQPPALRREGRRYDLCHGAGPHRRVRRPCGADAPRRPLRAPVRATGEELPRMTDVDASSMMGGRPARREWEVLVLCARSRPEPRVDDRLRILLSGPLDWELLMRMAWINRMV